MFPASHNPAVYSGIKLCRTGARPVGQDTGLAEVRDLAERILAGDVTGPVVRAAACGSATCWPISPPSCAASSTCPASARSPSSSTRATGWADTPCRPSSAPAPGSTPCRSPSSPMYFELDGTFHNHEANPLDPKNLVDLEAAVRAAPTWPRLRRRRRLRCFVIDERGEPVSPSAITALIARREVTRAVADGADAADVAIVHNVICSAQVPEVIAETGARAVRTRVGHSFIKAEMARQDAVFGGEHSATTSATSGSPTRACSRRCAPSRRSASRTPPQWRHGRPAPVCRLRRDQLHRHRRPRRHRRCAWATSQGVKFADELDGLTLVHGGGDGDPMCGSTCGPPTPNPCCGSTSRRPTTPRWSASATRSSRSSAPDRRTSAAPPAGSGSRRPCGRIDDESPPVRKEPAGEQATPTSPIEPWLREILRCPACTASCGRPAPPGPDSSARAPSAGSPIASMTAFRSPRRRGAPPGLTPAAQGTSGCRGSTRAAWTTSPHWPRSTAATRCSRSRRPAPGCGAPRLGRRGRGGRCLGGERPRSVLVARSAGPPSCATSSTSSPSPVLRYRSPRRDAPLPGWSGPARPRHRRLPVGRAAGPLALAAEAARRASSSPSARPGRRWRT